MIGNPARSGGVLYFKGSKSPAMQINNKFLTATINPKGAELQSLTLNATGHQYIWEADPAHWGKHAPVLFPFIGMLKGGNYKYGDKQYPMDKHGFARDHVFELVKRDDEQVTFRLASTDALKRKYPFDFELDINYRFKGQSIINAYTVRNLGDERMPFSLGGHPAFRCPQINAEQRSDYRLVFNEEENIETHLLNEEGFFSGATRQCFSGKELPITDPLFDDDALVFKSLKSTNVSLESGDKRWLKFHFQGFPYLGIWSMSRTSPFVCIEPWFGMADHVAHDGVIEKKEGVQWIDPRSTFSCDFRVEVF